MEDHDARNRAEALARQLIEKHNLRVRDNTARYLRDRATRDELSDVPVIGSDARTGIPRRVILPAADLASLQIPHDTY